MSGLVSSYRLFLFRVVRVFSTMPRIAGFQKVLTINTIAIVLMVNFMNSNVYVPLAGYKIWMGPVSVYW